MVNGLRVNYPNAVQDAFGRCPKAALRN